jgi:glutathione S-transferase
MADVTFYHSPQSRSSGVKVLLEELGAPYDLEVLNTKAGEQRGAAYLAVNPAGKVPAILDRGELVTEQAAIFIHLADRFPEKGLAPAIGGPLRGSYLRWMVYYGSCFEPAVVDRAMKREPGTRAMSPYGDYDLVMRTVVEQLRAGPYLLGTRFSAADILWGMALTWTTSFGLVPKEPEIARYIEAFGRRPSVAKVTAEDAELAAGHQVAVDAAAG